MVRFTDYPLLVFVLSAVVLWIAELVGMYLRGKPQGLEKDEREDLSMLLAGALTLLGLIIGFTFSMAVARCTQVNRPSQGGVRTRPAGSLRGYPSSECSTLFGGPFPAFPRQLLSGPVHAHDLVQHDLVGCLTRIAGSPLVGWFALCFRGCYQNVFVSDVRSY